MGLYSYGTGNSFMASRTHFEDYFWPNGVNRRGKGEGARGANSLPSKITIWGSVIMFLGTGNSFLASRTHFEDYFWQKGVNRRGKFFPPLKPQHGALFLFFSNVKTHSCSNDHL